MSISQRITEGLKRAAARTGGAPLTGTINRTTGADTSTYPAIGGATTQYPATMLIVGYSAEDRDGTQVTAQDTKILVSADADVAPENGDTVTVAGQTYSVESVDTIRPGGVALMHTVQARRS